MTKLNKINRTRRAMVHVFDTGSYIGKTRLGIYDLLVFKRAGCVVGKARDGFPIVNLDTLKHPRYIRNDLTVIEA